MSKKRKYLSFLLIVLGNTLMKSAFSAWTPFSYDEIISVKDTLLDFGHIKHESEWDNNPPFYYYCLWIWHQLIPVSEFNTRFLSVIFISLSAGVVFLWTLRYSDLKTALCASLLFSVSDFVFFYAQEARTYSLVVLLSLLSSVVFFRCTGRRRLPDLISLGVINFLLVYSHYLTGLIILLQAIVVFTYFHKDTFRYIMAHLFLVGGLVMLRFTKKQFLNILGFNQNNDFWLQKATLSDLGGALTELYYTRLVAVVFLVSALLFAVGYFRGKIDDPFRFKFYCFLMGFVSVFLLFIAGLWKPLFLARYLLFAVSFATILVVGFLLSRPLKGGLITCLIFVFSVAALNLKKYSGSDYKSVCRVLKQTTSPDDLIVINTRDNLPLFLYYFDRELFFKYKYPDSIARTKNIYAVNEPEDLVQILPRKSGAIFLLQSFHTIRNKKNFVKEEISKVGEQVYTGRYPGVEFSVFSPR